MRFVLPTNRQCSFHSSEGPFKQWTVLAKMGYRQDQLLSKTGGHGLERLGDFARSVDVAEIIDAQRTMLRFSSNITRLHELI